MNITEKIYAAIEKEDWKEIKRLLESEIELKPEEYVRWKVEHEGYTLYKACEKGEIGVVKYLMKNNCSTISDNELMKAVIVAVKNDKLDIVDLLIGEGINKSSWDNIFEINELMGLMISKKCHKLLIKITNASKEYKNVVLGYAAEYNDLELVKGLFDPADDFNDMVLYRAIMNKNMEIAMFCLENGVTFKKKKQGNDCLRKACRDNDINLVKILLKYDIKPNKQILRLAEKSKNKEIFDAMKDYMIKCFIE